MAARKKLYGYGGPDNSPHSLDHACLVSEVRLLKPSKKMKGESKAYFYFTRGLTRASRKLGSLRNLACVWGEPPIIFRRCRMLSLDANPIPDEATDLLKKPTEQIVVFQYNGGRVWIELEITCLLKDIKEQTIT